MTMRSCAEAGAAPTRRNARINSRVDIPDHTAVAVLRRCDRLAAAHIPEYDRALGTDHAAHPGVDRFRCACRPAAASLGARRRLVPVLRPGRLARRARAAARAPAPLAAPRRA